MTPARALLLILCLPLAAAWAADPPAAAPPSPPTKPSASHIVHLDERRLPPPDESLRSPNLARYLALPANVDFAQDGAPNLLSNRGTSGQLTGYAESAPSFEVPRADKPAAPPASVPR